MNRLLRISLVSTLALSACNPHVSGNGVLGEETRTVAPFDGVDISLAAEAIVTANATTQKLTISVDENLLQYILTPVENGVLRMRLNGITGIDSIHPLRLVAQAKALHYVRASEAANVDVKDAGDPAPGFVFEVVATGLSNVQLQGNGGDRLQVNLSGGSWLDAWSYPVAGANVVLTGGSTLRVNSVSDVVGSAADKSDVKITGGGTCKSMSLSGLSTCSPP
jgi:Putative auto-transporter adhesin, head GIN domain